MAICFFEMWRKVHEEGSKPLGIKEHAAGKIQDTCKVRSEDASFEQGLAEAASVEAKYVPNLEQI